MGDELGKAIERCRNYKMTPKERFLQKVSFCYGQQDYDSPNQRTKRQVAEFLAEHDGYPPEWVELVQPRANTPNNGEVECKT